ncbi:hypothetical protein [Streptomyces sp. NPDC127038]|uniref:hypothetical protein n=1 Tax=Streptomyces sp. NPDC127038 TaxID=3347114 RepID=UPI003648AE1E
MTAAMLAAAFPGLRWAYPSAIGQALADVQLDANGTARYAWAGYEVHVSVAHEDHLDGNPESNALHRQVRAHCVLLVPGVADALSRGHVEWDMANPRPEVVFPAAYAVATADSSDPRFASAVLATVGRALDHVRIASGHAQGRTETAAQEVL